MRINQFKLNPIEKNGQYVLTTAQLAQAYGVDIKVISYNFNHNKSHYTEGVHYYRITGKELKAIREFHDLPKNINTLYLWTERGALLHAKSLNTEKAWEVYEFLVDNYFRTREIITSENCLSVKVIEKLELMEIKIDALEKEIKNLDKKSDNILKTLFDMSSNVISKGFQIIYDKFSK